MEQRNGLVDVEIAPGVPRAGNGFTRWVGHLVLFVLGWRVVGRLPDHKKLVVAAAPHTSNWDFIVAVGGLLALGIRLHYLMKKEAFFWPFKGFFMWLGGIPIDRSAASNTVEQIGEWYREHESVWVVITPEGTRSKVEKWKTGFLRIAHQAQVPVLLVAWDYPTKTITLDNTWETTGNHEQDAVAIRQYVNQTYRGRHPEKQ